MLQERPTRRKANYERIALKRAKGLTMPQIAKEEGVTKEAVFYALRHVKPELREVLRLNKYDLNRAVRNMIQMTAATKTSLAVFEGKFSDSREIPDNQARFNARKEMLRIHGVSETTTIELTGMVEHVLSLKEKQEASESVKALAAYEGTEADDATNRLPDGD